MGYFQGKERNQFTFMPECIDKYIREDNPIRVTDTFVNSLNMEELGFIRSYPAGTGRPLNPLFKVFYLSVIAFLL